MFDQVTRVAWIPLAFCVALVGAIGVNQVSTRTAGRGGHEHAAGTPAHGHDDPFAGAQAGAEEAAAAAAAPGGGAGEAVDNAQLVFEAQLDSSRQRLLQAIQTAGTLGDQNLSAAVVAADEAVGRVVEAAAATFDDVRVALDAGADRAQARNGADARLAVAAAEVNSTFAVAEGALVTAGTGGAAAPVLDEISDTVLDAEAEATGALTDARAAIDSILQPVGSPGP